MGSPKYQNRVRRPIRVDSSGVRDAIRGRIYTPRPGRPNDEIAGAIRDLGGRVPQIPPRLVDGVFEGGGALGTAYMGALRALDGERIWFSRVAGNSAGSITAAMIAVGFSAPEVQWLSSAFPGAGAPPADLANRNITQPIQFGKFLDIPSEDSVSLTSIRRTLLYQALKLSVIDQIGSLRAPIPTQSEAVNAATDAILSQPILGPVLRAVPEVSGLLKGALNIALSPLPDSRVLIKHLLPQTDALRDGLAIALWREIAKAMPVQYLLTNLLHEGSLFEGEEFLKTIKELFGKKVHGNAAKLVTFRDLRIPLAVIAADIASGTMRVYSSQTDPDFEVAEAVRRSMSVPLVFQSRRGAFSESGRQFMDGGLCSNFPLWLFTEGGDEYWPPATRDAGRAKIGFTLDETQPAPAGWGVQPPRFQTTGTPPRVDGDQVIVPLLTNLLEEAGVPTSGPSFPIAQTMEHLASLRVVRELAWAGVDKEVTTHRQVTKGLMSGKTYFDVAVPLLGYHWLDFGINADEDDAYSMWDRAWHATMDALRAAPLTGVGSPMFVATNTQSPYRVG